MAAEGVDPRSLKLDWEKVKESQRDKAVREVKASMLLAQDRGAGERFTPPATKWTGKWRRLPGSSASRWRRCTCEFEKDGTLGRIACHIQTEKTLNFLFEHARKTAECSKQVVNSADSVTAVRTC